MALRDEAWVAASDSSSWLRPPCSIARLSGARAGADSSRSSATRADPAELLSDEVLGLSWTVGDSGHVVVQELGFPRGDRLCQSSEFGDLGLGGALVERHQLPSCGLE